MNQIYFILFLIFIVISIQIVYLFTFRKFFPYKTKHMLKQITEKPIKISIYNAEVNKISRGVCFKLRFYDKGVLVSFYNRSIWTDYKDIDFDESFMTKNMKFIQNNNTYKISISKSEIEIIKKRKNL